MSFYKKIIHKIFYILFFPFWIMEKFIKRNKYSIVFGSFVGRDFSDNSKAFYDYVKKK
jgi:CDP-glycerol glycerophosphotransferase (TagB/SpsB family)